MLQPVDDDNAIQSQKFEIDFKVAYASAISRAISFVIALSWNELIKKCITYSEKAYLTVLSPIIVTLIGTYIVALLTFLTA